MIFIFLDFLSINFFAAVIFVGAMITALVLGISFHEFSHAFVADRLGDGLPRRMGRLTLNPLAHLEPVGTMLMLLVGFGWGRPVPVNPNATRNPKATLGFTAAAGPLSNFVVAAIAGLPIKLNLVSWTSPFIKDNARALAVHGWTSGEYLSVYLSAIVLFSLILGVFNLLPIAPLDGFKVALGFLPRDLSIEFAKLERYGLVILFSLFFVVPLLTGKFLLFEIMSPIIRVLAWLFAGTSGDPFV
ncbi:MAG: site-2 protease family protein [Chloroflexi bacterium]|jgi:Zn-dependent protease|nr:MAG: site-2 protease family protein [Chloroflexota bacterium]TMG09822.1 MAG: site-2 protease family protein [Chloroflexota bacterium]